MNTLPNNSFLLKKIPSNACKQAQYWEKVFELAGIPNDNNGDDHYAKSVRIRSCSGPYFPAFGINTERQQVSLQVSPLIQSKCGKMRTKVFSNMGTLRSGWYRCLF